MRKQLAVVRVQVRRHHVAGADARDLLVDLLGPVADGEVDARHAAGAQNAHVPGEQGLAAEPQQHLGWQVRQL
jgi:hypothetical protein